MKINKETIIKISREELIHMVLRELNNDGKVTMSKLSSDGLKLWVKEDE
jgi:hypothetical protein